MNSAYNKIQHHETSDESGDSVSILDLEPQEVQVQGLEAKPVPAKIYANVMIKGGKVAKFYVDIGATCNVIPLGELTGTKYWNKVLKTNQILKMYDSSPLKPLGKCQIQLTNPATQQKYKVLVTVVKDTESKVNL